MQLTSKSAGAAMLLLAITVLSTLFAPQPASADKPNPTQPVLVVNSAGTPVPVVVQSSSVVGVTGSVEASQSGPWTVGVAAGTTVGLAPGATVGLANGATVLVGNSESAPVFIRDVDAAREPYQAYSGLVLFNPLPNVHSYSFGAVPAGKRLVIEHFSGRIYNAGNGAPFYAKLFAGSGVDILVPHQLGANEPYMFNTETRMYASAQQAVTFETNINGQGYMELFVSGYLVPAP